MAEILIGNVKGPQGIPGETGATGAPGAAGSDGAAATVNVGTVSTVAYGTPASVTNSGTEAAAVLDFVIPQGKPGEETTRMSGLTLDQITAQSATYPIPAVGESGATIWGKVVKFFTDIKNAVNTKLSGADCVTVLTSTETQKPLAASAGKALNDAITSQATRMGGLIVKSITLGSTQTKLKMTTTATNGKVPFLIFGSFNNTPMVGTCLMNKNASAWTANNGTSMSNGNVSTLACTISGNSMTVPVSSYGLYFVVSSHDFTLEGAS